MDLPEKFPRYTNVLPVELIARCPNCGEVPIDAENRAPFTVRNIIFGWNCPECEGYLEGLYSLFLAMDTEKASRLVDAAFKEDRDPVPHAD